MKPPFAAQAREAGSRTGTAAGRQFSPVAFALDRLFPKHGRAPYSAAERLVVLVIVRATSADGSSGDFNCFLSYPTIAKWAGVSIASVKRALQKHCDGPAPLLYRSTGPRVGRLTQPARRRFSAAEHRSGVVQLDGRAASPGSVRRRPADAPKGCRVRPRSASCPPPPPPRRWPASRRSRPPRYVLPAAGGRRRTSLAWTSGQRPDSSPSTATGSRPATGSQPDVRLVRRGRRR